MSRILVVSGSPRAKGNCSVLIEQFCFGASQFNATIEVVRLHDRNIHPCAACRSCKESDEANCVIDDGMTDLYPKIRAAQALVIASPIYWWNVSAQTKLFLDRCDALDGPSGNVLRGKALALLLAYGGESVEGSGASHAIGAFQDAAEYIGFNLVGIAHGTAWEAGEIRENEIAMEMAYQVGADIARIVTK
ncbi:MAG: flavodoxin family protein [Lentisphaeria bacterium]|nr:flavodoxin family protein [Lentisphaeria bacterium]